MIAIGGGVMAVNVVAVLLVVVVVELLAVAPVEEVGAAGPTVMVVREVPLPVPLNTGGG